MKKFLPLLALLVFAPLAHAQIPVSPAIELKCPSGTTLLPGHQTLNASTGAFRQNVCVDPNGKITFNDGVPVPSTTVSAASYAGADWCAKVQAADAAAGANPAIIIVPSTIAGTCAGTLTFAYNGLAASRVIEFDIGTFTGAIAPLPNDGNSSPGQAPFRFEGQLISFDALLKTSTGGSFLNLTNNATNGKIETLGAGTLEVDHLIIEDTSTDCAPFFLDTNTVLRIHDNVFIGTASGTSACNDVFILGGTGTTNGNLTTSLFSGYGSTIRENSFEQIRRVALLQSGANNIQFVDNNVDANSGFSTGGAFEFNPTTQASGNYIAGNLFEATNYEFFSNVTTNTGTVTMNDFVGNGLFDSSATTSAYFNWNAITNTNVTKNLVILGVNGTPTNGLGINVRQNWFFGPNAGTANPASANSNGTCTMSAGTSCTLANVYGTHCVATVQSATVIGAGCTVSGTTATVTAASSNSSVWAVWVF